MHSWRCSPAPRGGSSQVLSFTATELLTRASALHSMPDLQKQRYGTPRKDAKNFCVRLKYFPAFLEFLSFFEPSNLSLTRGSPLLVRHLGSTFAEFSARPKVRQRGQVCED